MLLRRSMPRETGQVGENSLGVRWGFLEGYFLNGISYRIWTSFTLSHNLVNFLLNFYTFHVYGLNQRHYLRHRRPLSVTPGNWSRWETNSCLWSTGSLSRNWMACITSDRLHNSKNCLGVKPVTVADILSLPRRHENRMMLGLTWGNRWQRWSRTNVGIDHVPRLKYPIIFVVSKSTQVFIIKPLPASTSSISTSS